MGWRDIGVRFSIARAWRPLLLLALVGMVLSSLGGAIAASQANPPIEQEEQADQPAIETAEPAATQPPDTGEATEPPVAPTEDAPGAQVDQAPVERESAQPPFFLQLIKRVCPAREGFVPEAAPYAELDDACRLEVADPANFFFIVTDATGAQRVANDIAPFFELPPGRTRAAEKHAGGYGDPVVWCSFGKGEPPQRMQVANREVALDPTPEMLVTCEFFNPELPPEPPAEGGTGSITVVKVACPAGYDAMSEKADPLVDCTKPMDDVGFALMPADPEVGPQKGRTGDDGRGTVTFEELPAGRYTLEETLPEGIADAVVWACTDDPRQQAAFDGPLATGTRLEVELAEGQHLWCLWLNVMDERPAEPTPETTPTPEPTPTAEPTPTSGGENSVTIYKWQCPEETPNDRDLDWYASSCAQEMLGVPFELTSAAGTTTVLSQANGTHFDDLPAGTITVREEIPDGYGVPRVFCELVNMAPPVEIPVTNGAVQLDIGAGDLLCYWYNIPEPPATAAPLPTESAFVIDPNAPGGTAPPTETSVPVADPDGPATVGTAPGETNTVTVRKWACPPGTAYGQSEAWYIETCFEPMDGVAFRLVTASGAMVGTTQGGAVAWSDLPRGNVGLRETIPDGYGDPVMYCRSNVFGTTVYNPLDDGIVGWGVPDDRAYTFDCDWYNVPLPDALTVGDTGAPAGSTTTEATLSVPWTPAPEVATIAPTSRAGAAATSVATETAVAAEESARAGVITVLKVTCPEGIAIENLDASMVGDCDRPTDDISFTLTGADGEVSQRGRTGANGRGTLAFAGLPPGTYEIVEAQPPAGTGTVVWACLEDPRELGNVTEPLARGTAVTVELEAGQRLTCLWINAEAAGSPGDGAGLAPATMSLHLTARECGPTPLDSQTIAGYRASCLDRAQVQFTVVLTLPDEIRNFQAQKVDEQGVVALVDLPVSEPSIFLHRIGGYSMPSVFCRADGAWSAASVDVAGVSWVHRLPLQEPGAQIVCEWYIPVEPEPQPGVFEVRHFVCDAGVAAPSEGTCTSNTQGFFYRVRAAGEPEPTGSSGRFPLPYHLTVPRDVPFEIIDDNAPAVARPPAVFCGPWVHTGGPLETHPNHGWLEAPGEARIAFASIGVDESLRCDWYTFPASASGELPSAEPAADDPEALAGSGRVRVVMYQCLPGMAYDALAMSAETQPHGVNGLCQPFVDEGIILRHADATGSGTVSRTRFTGPNGGASWGDGVPAGPWTLMRAPWQGQEGDPLVMCRYLDPPEGVDVGWRVHPGAAGGIHDDAFPAEDMLAECFWYVIPIADPGGSNRVDLTVYDCPAGTTADAIIAAWPAGGETACAPATGVEVTLSYAGRGGVGAIMRPLVTDANGRAFWGDGVPTAPWSLSRGTGTGDALVACRYDAVPGAEPEWRFDLVVEDGVFASTFAGVYDHPPEQQADLLDRCHWFSIP